MLPVVSEFLWTTFYSTPHSTEKNKLVTYYYYSFLYILPNEFCVRVEPAAGPWPGNFVEEVDMDRARTLGPWALHMGVSQPIILPVWDDYMALAG